MTRTGSQHEADQAAVRHIADLHPGEQAWLPAFRGTRRIWTGPFAITAVRDHADGFAVEHEKAHGVGEHLIPARAAVFGARMVDPEPPRRRPRATRHSDATVRAIRRMLDDGATIRQVAVAAGCSEPYVRMVRDGEMRAEVR